MCDRLTIIQFEGWGRLGCFSRVAWQGGAVTAAANPAWILAELGLAPQPIPEPQQNRWEVPEVSCV